MGYESRKFHQTAGHSSLHLSVEGDQIFIDVMGRGERSSSSPGKTAHTVNVLIGKFLGEIGKILAENPELLPERGVKPTRGGSLGVDQLQKLAGFGRKLFNDLIPASEQQRFLRALLPAGKGGKRSFRISRPIVDLGVAASRVPWNLMYVDEGLPEHAHDVKGFLGAKILFLGQSRVVDTLSDLDLEDLDQDTTVEAQSTPSGRHPSPKPSDGGKVGHIWDDDFLTTAVDEFWFEKAGVDRDELDKFELQTDAEIAQTTAAFVLKPRSRLHLDCHGHLDPHGEFLAHSIGVRNRKRQPYSALSAWDFAENQDLLITLNVCHSGSGRLGNAELAGLAEWLKGKRAGAVIGPFTKIPFPMAMAFMARLHSHVRGNRAYIEAFDTAQTELMKRHPAALSYVCFGEAKFLAGGLADTPAQRELAADRA